MKPRNGISLRWTLIFLAGACLPLVLSGCSGSRSSVHARSEASSSPPVCIPQNLTCQRPPGLSKLKTVGSCKTTSDCTAAVGLSAVCTLADDGSGDLCEVACNMDGDCPVGAYCSDIGRCSYDCDGTAALACPSGESCNCDGRCVTTCQAPPQAPGKPVLSTSVPALTLVLPSSVATASATGEVDVILTAPTAVIAAASKGIAISVSGDPGITVSCDPAGNKTGAAFPQTCALGNWTFTAAGSQWIARQPVWVRLVPWAGQLKTQMFQLTVAGNGVVNPTQLVTIVGKQQSPLPTVVGDGSYSGTVTMQASANGPSSDDVVIPVDGYLRNGNLVLVDPTGALSSSGLVFVSSKLSSYQGNSVDNFAGMTGSYWPFTFQPISLTQSVQEGAVVGSYKIVDGWPRALGQIFSFNLTPRGALPSCSATGSTCPTGTSCDAAAQLCTPLLTAPVVYYGPGPYHTLENAWVGQVKQLLWSFPSSAVPQKQASYSAPTTTSTNASRYILTDVYGDLDETGNALSPPQIRRNYFVGGEFAPDIGYQLCQRDFGTAISRAVPNAPDSHYWGLLKRDVRTIDGSIVPGPDLDGLESSGFWEMETPDVPQGGIHYFPTVTIGVWGSYAGSISTNDPIMVDLPHRQNSQGNWINATTGICSRLYTQANHYSNGVPCLIDAPNSPASGSGWWSHAADHMMCSSLYNRATQLHPWWIGNFSFENYRTGVCQKTQAVFILNDTTNVRGPYGSGWEDRGTLRRSFDVYLCESDYSEVDHSFADLDCYDPSTVAAPAITETAPMSNVVMPASGDLRCAPNLREPCSTTMNPGVASCGGNVPLSFPFYTAPDYYSLINNWSGWTPTDEVTYSACLAELSLTPEAAKAGVTDPIQVLNQLFTRPSCVSLARVLPLAFFNFPQNYPRYYLHVLSQWLGVHRFVASQSILRSLGDRMEDENDATRDLSIPLGLDAPETVGGQTLAAPLDVIEGGLALLLGGADGVLSTMPGAALADPDYRKEVPGFSDSSKGRQQVEGLPVVMLQTLGAYFDALDFHAQQINQATYDACPGNDAHGYRSQGIARINAGLRLATVLEMHAESLTQRAIDSGTPVGWKDKWAAARTIYFAGRARLQGRLNELLQCHNPLGINDHDTPIFFASGTAGPTAATFSSADFLMPLAQQAVSDATTALTAARTAWNNRATDGYNKELYSTDRAKRIYNAASKYGSTLLDLCGKPPNVNDAATMLEQFSPATSPPPPILLTADNCYYANEDPSCRGATTIDPKCLRGQLGEAAVAIVSANKTVEVARSQLQDAVTRFNVTGQYCAQLAKETDKIVDLTDMQNRLVEGLTGLIEMDSTLQNMLGQVTGGIGSAVGTFGVSVVLSLFQCGADLGVAAGDATGRFRNSNWTIRRRSKNSRSRPPCKNAGPRMQPI